MGKENSIFQILNNLLLPDEVVAPANFWWRRPHAEWTGPEHNLFDEMPRVFKNDRFQPDWVLLRKSRYTMLLKTWGFPVSLHTGADTAWEALLEIAAFPPVSLDSQDFQRILDETLQLYLFVWDPHHQAFFHHFYGSWKELYFDSLLAEEILDSSYGHHIAAGIKGRVSARSYECFSPALALRLGIFDSWWPWFEGHVAGLLATQLPNGLIPYQPPATKVEKVSPKVVPGQMAQYLDLISHPSILERSPEFERNLKLGVSFLKTLDCFPHGGQTWEIDPWVPDLLTVANIVRIFLQSYRLWGDKTGLDYALRWAYRGLPFVISSRNGAFHARQGATIPCFGVTRDKKAGAHWVGYAHDDMQSWWQVGCPWVGLEYAEALVDLYQAQGNRRLLSLAEGIVAGAFQLRDLDHSKPKRLPDAYNLRSGEIEYPMWVVPRNLSRLCRKLLALREGPTVTSQSEFHLSQSLPIEALPVAGSSRNEFSEYPEHAYIDLTGRCNIDCIICPHTYSDEPVRNRPLMSDRVLAEIQRALYPHMKAITFSCSGESLIHPRAKEILRACYHHAFLPILLTNGTLLKEEAQEILVSIGAYLRFSIDGASREVFEHVRQGAKFDTVMGHLSETVHLQERVKNPRFCLRLDTTVHKENIEELPAIVDLAADQGVEQVYIHHLYSDNIPRKDLPLFNAPQVFDRFLLQALQHAVQRRIYLAMPEPFSSDQHYLGEFQALKALLPANRMAPFLPRSYGPDTTFTCRVPWKDVVVKPDGNVSYCCLLGENVHLGNLEQESFEEVWFGAAYSSLREQVNSPAPPKQCHPSRCGIRKTFFTAGKVGENRQHLNLTSRYPNDVRFTAEVRSWQKGRGGEIHLEMAVQNTGDTLWYSALSLPQGEETGAVRVGFQICSREGELVSRDWLRWNFPSDVPPGQSVLVSGELPHPPAPWEDLKIKCDLVVEGICWFEEKGGEPLWLPVFLGLSREDLEK